MACGFRLRLLLPLHDLVAGIIMVRASPLRCADHGLEHRWLPCGSLVLVQLTMHASSAVCLSEVPTGLQYT